MKTVFATRTRTMGASAIREILKQASRPGMISLAGGLPAPEAFPMDLVPELTARVMEKCGPAALQYDRTEGFEPLRQALAHFLSETKCLCTGQDEILVSSGSQGVLDALGKVLISPGDRVAVEAPTYLGAIQAFNPYEPRYAGLETDDQGLIPESVETALKSGPIQLIYLTPTFQNPTGRTLSVSRRMRLADIIQRHGLLAVEDDPYGDLRYSGSSLPPLKLFAPDNVIYVGTFSKIFAPGLRVGYCVAPEKVGRWLTLAKQGVDLHTSTFCQALAAEYLAGGYLNAHLSRITACYKPRLDAMLQAMENGFPDQITWSRPKGGMFVWVQGPEWLDVETLYHQALEKQVAVVPGKYFFTDPRQGGGTMRLNFTQPDVPAIHRAMGVLSDLLHIQMEKSRKPGRTRTRPAVLA